MVNADGRESGVPERETRGLLVSAPSPPLSMDQFKCFDNSEPAVLSSLIIGDFLVIVSSGRYRKYT